MAKLLLALSVLAGAAGAKGKPIMHWNGSSGPAKAPEHRLVETQAEWDKLWKELGKPAPAADFKTHFAAAVFLGEKPTGGWGVRWSEPAPEGDKLVVRYAVKKPEGFVTQAFTRPWAVRLFERPKHPLELVLEAKP